MTAYDWTAEPTRPLSTEDVWALMTAGCRTGDIAAAAKVDTLTARGMMREAAKRQGGRDRLTMGIANEQG